mgnify:CR=1 FL=1|tara:strand:- start:17426 stop:17647 length:222 start_codon:yes stop_codon:yes gene_type:complete
MTKVFEYYTKMVETTVWEKRPETPNHTYYTAPKAGLVGYQINGEGPFIPHTSKLFSTSHRKFVKTRIKELPEV